MSNQQQIVAGLLRECLRDTHRHLVVAEGVKNPGVQNLRAELEGRFQGCGLQVNESAWVGGANAAWDIDVLWVDGPSVYAVMGYCGKFSAVSVDRGGKRLERAANTWRKTFGHVGAVRPKRSLSPRRAQVLVDFMAKKFGPVFERMKPFAVGGERPVLENQHLDEVVAFAGRRMKARDLLNYVHKVVSWEAGAGNRMTVDGARWDP